MGQIYLLKIFVYDMTVLKKLLNKYINHLGLFDSKAILIEKSSSSI